MIRQSPENKQSFRGMLVKVTGMLATKVLARMFRPGKEHARPVVARITVLPGVSSRAPDMRCSSKEEASRDIGKIMEILPLRGRDISNLSSSSISKTSNICSTSRSSSSKT
jgi:hypothetical protein